MQESAQESAYYADDRERDLKKYTTVAFRKIAEEDKSKCA
jgi:hypothetical protein